MKPFGLSPRHYSPARRWKLDIDYANKLSPDDAAWLAKALLKIYATQKRNPSIRPDFAAYPPETGGAFPWGNPPMVNRTRQSRLIFCECRRWAYHKAVNLCANCYAKKSAA